MELLISQIDSGEKISPNNIALHAIKNPCLWGVCIGILFGVSGLMNQLLQSSWGPVYTSAESMIVAPLSALILLSLGYDLVLKKEQIKGVLQFLFARLGVQMVLLLIVWQIYGRTASYEMQTAILLFFFLPCAFSCQVYVSHERSKEHIATFCSVYSLISLAVFSVLSIVR